MDEVGKPASVVLAFAVACARTTAVAAPQEMTSALISTTFFADSGGGSARQGLALGTSYNYTANHDSICRFSKGWQYIETVSISVAGVDHLGAIDYHDGHLWGGFLNSAGSVAKVARIRAGDLGIDRTWDLTPDGLTWIDPVSFDGQYLWIGSSPSAFHRYRLTEGDDLAPQGVLRYPGAMDFSQGIRVVSNRLYSIHTFGTMDGLFEFIIPETFTDVFVDPVRHWDIQESNGHLEGFAFLEGQTPARLWHAQIDRIDLYELDGIVIPDPPESTNHVGDWQWGAGGTVSPHNGEVWGNYAQNVYHASPQNSAAAANGIAQIRDGGGIDQFFLCDPIAELDNVQQFTWTFEDVTFKTGGDLTWPLVGATYPAPIDDINNKYLIQKTNDGRLQVGLFQSGDATAHWTEFGWTHVLDSRTYDIQVSFDGTKGTNDNVGLRYRESSDVVWPAAQWLGNTVTRLNTMPRAVSIGKTRPGSTLCGHMDLGRVTLSLSPLPPSVQVRPDHDNHVRVSEPDTVMTHTGNLALGNGDNVFLRFDISSIPAEVSVATAGLVMRTRNDFGTVKPVEINSIADDTWLETTITWNTQPAAGGYLGTYSVGPLDPGISQVDYVDVTSYVSSSHAAADTEISFRLHTPQSGSAMFIRADEHGDQSEHPWAMLYAVADAPVPSPRGLLFVVQ